MKKILLGMLPLLVSTYSYAQFATPTAGKTVTTDNVGIGTTNPTDLLYINTNSQRKGITINSDGDVSAYTDITLSINNTSANVFGTPLGWDISHRKDGYFSDTPYGQSSLEFYAYLSGGHYYAPLSFKPDGNVILASNKNALGGKVGIGLTDPTQALDVNGAINSSSNVTIGNIGSRTSFNNAYYVYNTGNCYGMDLGYNSSSSRFNTRLFTPTTADIVFSSIPSNTTPTSQAQFTQLLTIKGDNGNVGIGTADPGDYKLAVKGVIHSQAVQVDMNSWNDFVFDKEYHLTTLKDVEKYVDQNHHLPEIPSAVQVVKGGIDLGEMNAKLLKKIVELTLYLIQQNKELSIEKSKNLIQETLIGKQQKQLNKISKKLHIN